MRALLTLAICLTTTLFAETVSLFDGKTLDGWDFDPKIWRVENGVITGGSTTEKIRENHFICTKKSYQNFELKLKIKCSGDPATGMINSGIQIRSVRVPGGAHMSGYQADCGAGWFGRIYDEFRRNKVIAEPVDATALAKAVDVFGWNEYRIRAEGPRIQVWINGVLATDYTETDKNIALDGQIGPQVHSGGICLVQFKEVTVEELPPTPGAPTWESLGGVEAARKLVAPPLKPKSNAKADAPKTTKSGRDISYNNVQGTARSAAEQQKLFHLPEGFEIELVVQESEGLGKFVSVYFDQRGRMWTQTALEYPVDANENPAAAEAVYQGKGKDKVLVYPREAINGAIPEGGLKSPTVFCDGLAIPLGILPWSNGDTCYVQHGHDLKLFKDTDGDGKADTHDVVLTGFGVQDSHLFPHQFTRAPGRWIWMAQGLFNNSKVHKPGSDKVVDWPKCSMARMRPDGSQFEVISVGPNNIWGLVITGEGEAFIQEANDYGYPVMPFHEYAYYPGGMEALKKSYQPEFPPMAEFRMGGTGLSGLALGEGKFRKLTPTVKEDGLCMFVANPITSKVQTIAMHRDGPYWKLEQAADLITCDDPFFRPVGMTQGPDGCVYITDWYNKIISHNEVPRAHPDRDKTRGRIWRVKPTGAPNGARTLLSASTENDAANPPNPEEADRSVRAPLSIPDFATLSDEELIIMLGTQPTAKAELARHTLVDRRRGMAERPRVEWTDRLSAIAADRSASVARRIQMIWVLRELNEVESSSVEALGKDASALLRKEAQWAWPMDESYTPMEFADRMGFLADDPNPHVRSAYATHLGHGLWNDSPDHDGTLALLRMVRPSLPGPTSQSSRAPKQIPVREAYDREFERFLVRMFLERHFQGYRLDSIARFFDSEALSKLPIEARVLASLALEPKTSASRVAKLLPQLDRAPNDEELLRLAQFPEEPGIGDALNALLRNETSRAVVAEKLLAHRTKINPEEISPVLVKAAEAMLESPALESRQLGLKLIGGFGLRVRAELLYNPVIEREDAVLAGKQPAADSTGELVLRLNALRDLRSQEAETFFVLAKGDPDPAIRQAAFEALVASSTNVVESACARLFKLYPDLRADQRKTMLHALSGQAEGAAKLLVEAILNKSVPINDLDGVSIERLASVLGEDPKLLELQQQLGGVFREVLLLDGRETAWADSKITLDGAFTVECWVRLAEGITNQDGILGAPGQIDMNFHQSKFRVWIGAKGLHDVVIAKKPITPELWTHVAVTRDAAGQFKLYQNGELDSEGTKQTSAKFENCRLGWSGPAQGTNGAVCEFRVWKRERSAHEIRTSFDRILKGAPGMKRFDGAWGKLSAGARVAKTIDAPPLLSDDQVRALDTKFARYTALAQKPGNHENGKVLASLCMACHQIGNTGGQLGPNLSGAGAMGLEAVLRNILTPNAAMEPGYRTFRVEMNNGDLVDAFFVSEDKDAFVVRQAGLPDRRLAKAEVRSTRYIRRSLMPEGLLDALNDEQVTDLLGYLMSLK